LPSADRLAVTMTGELCDCFVSKAEGVDVILTAVERAAEGREVLVWRTDGQFTGPVAARTDWPRTASANWLALATFAGRFAPTGSALLIDIGSTTTDLIPLRNGRPSPIGWTDPERLRSGELIYTGVRRTPLCALLGVGVAAELFATTLDAWLLDGAIAEDPADRHTADGQPATRLHAHRRLARMICGDEATTTEAERRALARSAIDRQLALLGLALQQVNSSQAELPQAVILSGEGEFLAQRVLEANPKLSRVPRQSLAAHLGPERSKAACAHAVAALCVSLAQ
jgi:probable H4MPT-linked C1 transfer pathway protein